MSPAVTVVTCGRQSCDHRITNRSLDKVATCGYNIAVDRIKSVGIRKLRNSLSAYIKEVRSGSVILVTDHGTVVAELRRPQESHRRLEVERIMQQWVDADKLILPSTARTEVRLSPLASKAGTAARLLEHERGERT